jgi:hypothetical protein
MKTNSVFKPYCKTRGKQRATSYATLGAVVLMLFSASTLAERPAMENRLDDGIAAIVNEREIAEDKLHEEQAAEQQIPARPQAEPSAVEIMMQTQQAPQTQHSGDVIRLAPTEMQTGETINIKLLDEPRRGMHMEKVQQLYGQPLATTASVGTPPISSWTYSDRIVYFEYSTVLHVVAR